MIERVDPGGFGSGVAVDDQAHAAGLRNRVAQIVHRAEFPCRIDVEQGEWRGRGEEGFSREVEHHRRILADAVEQDGRAAFRNDLTEDMDRLRLQPIEMAEAGAMIRNAVDP